MKRYMLVKYSGAGPPQTEWGGRPRIFRDPKIADRAASRVSASVLELNIPDRFGDDVAAGWMDRHVDDGFCCDFHAAGGLGPNWSQYYEGVGNGRFNTDGYTAQWVGQLTERPEPVCEFYGRMPPGTDCPPEQRIGARLRHDTTCTTCGGRFGEGHAFSADLAPNMAGTFRHMDCADPKLERADVDG